MSIKTAMQIVRLTHARTESWEPSEIRRTRLKLAGGVRGLISVDTEEPIFYQWPPALYEWLLTNKKYFESPNTPAKLVPRGVILDGRPGVGKSLGARQIAHVLKTPLYRLDISQTLGKYIGESEQRIAQSLALAEQESPCVLLIDEVEKVFSQNDDNGVITRILSQLLWWLSEHKSRVITVMTTNNIKAIPPELYRPGRIDLALSLPLLNLQGAKQFCLDVYKDIVGEPPQMAVQGKLRELVEATGKADLAHSEVVELVASSIKKFNWISI